MGQNDFSQWKSLDESTDPDDVGVSERGGNPVRPIVFPNPVDNWLTLPSVGERTRVEIYDANGKSLYAGFLSGDCRLDVSALNSGVYLLNVYGNVKVVYKFIKM